MVVGRISRVGGIYGVCRGRNEVLKGKGKGKYQVLGFMCDVLRKIK